MSGRRRIEHSCLICGERFYNFTYNSKYCPDCHRKYDKEIDSEIKKALEGMINFADMVDKVVLDAVDVQTLKNILDLINRLRAVLDLINRLQAENDNYSHNNRTMTKDILDLQKENEELRVTIKAFTDFGKLYSEIKAEAYKECIEKVKEKANKFKWHENSEEPFIIEYRIGKDRLDNLLEELVGE